MPHEVPKMTSAIDQKLQALGIELPTPSAPGANYVPTVRTGNLLLITGQLSQWNGERRFVGKLGREFSVEEGQQAARLCALNLLAHARAAMDGNLDNIVRCLRVAGYVNGTPEFTG
jgi:enamine deaminase RidA (YjgF/YER057c/UK114 family)